ncbi:MAG: YegS/Rv2252/BmrU family lipid kinase [Cyclobacteriaceae bacterium]
MNNEVKKVLFIVNKFSGGGYQPALEGNILAACKKYGVACAIEFTKVQGHATTLAREAIGSFDKVIAVGGDGTVNEVAQGLLHSPVVMGILPKGSGNGLARHLRIPTKITQALECLFNSQVIAMDTFLINDKLSLNVSGIGFDGHIANLFKGDKTRGFHGYTKLTLSEFIQFSEFEADISIGNILLKKKAFVIAIANSSQYGNNALIAPEASVCDSLLHISILKKMPPYRLDFIYSFFAGTIGKSEYCEIIEARDLIIQLQSQIPYHIDGEPGGMADRFVIKMIPASIHMLAPSNISHP